MDRKRGTSMIELGKTYQDKSGNSVRIICVDRKGGAPFSVIGLCNECGMEDIKSYTAEGTRHRVSGSGYDLILPEDYSTYVIDEPVMVRDTDEELWLRRYFAGVRGGRPCVFCGGATSWSMDRPSDILPWSQCRRPTKEELGK